ncbi:unnamed protein product [Effrenium voratum]|nr:unnamed protein product [Effrenium voratum]
MKREGLHFFAKCKCSGYEAVLTHECGDQAGERKFDLSRLPEEEAWGRKRIIPSCQCRATLPDGQGGRVVPWNAYYEAPAGREAPTAESTTSPAEPTAESTTSPPEPTTESTTSPPEPSLDMTAVCGRFSAVPREGVFHKKGCKCRHESYLSLACGKGLGLRKFDPHNEEVQDPNCKCIDEGEQIRKGQVTGPLAEPPAPMAKMAPPSGTLSPEEMDNYEDQASSMPEVRCKIPPPEPFHFGDMVRINKQVDDGHYFEFAGIGLWKKRKDVKLSGTIAQVVCTEESSGAQGRVCLRKGGFIAKYVGCWTPEHLVKMD